MSGIIDPGSVSPIKPTPPVPGPTEVTPKGPEEPREFKGPGMNKGPEESAAAKPSPMEIAERQGSNKPVTPESLQEQMAHLQELFSNAQGSLKDPRVANGLRADQQEALGKWVDKLNPEMSRIAKNSEVDFTPKEQGKAEKIVDFVSKWLDGSQGTLGNAIGSVGAMDNPSPAAMMNLQFAVQRATQRGELFSSIIGGSVSAIKTIMSTQLG